jgi:acetoin utilization deacetylase AcuC-like enzyme
MLPFPLVYHDGYDLNFGRHVFPTIKYRLIRQLLLEKYIAGPEDFLIPEPASSAELRLVHTDEWITKLETGTLTYQDILRLEVPYSRRMVEAFFLAAGGTILAARAALSSGVAVNVGGGFHHAFPGHGEGFCAIHDVAVGIRTLQREGAIRTAIVVDTDVHQGNGTAAIFAEDPSVFTFSIHQYNNYPYEKPPSGLDIHLPDGTGDSEYLARLEEGLSQSLAGAPRDLLMYVAGSDAYRDDQLGGLSLTKEGMFRRDRMVFDAARRRGIPVCVTLAGGYARMLEDTVELHTATVLAAREVLAA